jgi:CheY-like chemotaxis protein
MSSPSQAAGRPKILVVEDEPDVRRMIVQMLGTIADVTAAGDGAEALDQLMGGFLPDLIVTDLMMPHMDGLTLVGHLKGDPRLGRIPVVMLTAKTSPRDMVSGINAGARHYITKPFKTEELVGKVRKALGLRA